MVPGFGGAEAVRAAAPQATVRPVGPDEAEAVAAEADLDRLTVLVVEGAAPPDLPGTHTMAAQHFLLDRDDIAAYVSGQDGHHSAVGDTENIDAIIDRIHHLTAGWPLLVARACDALSWRRGGTASSGHRLDLAEYAVAATLREHTLATMPQAWSDALTYLAVAGTSSLRELVEGVTTIGAVNDLRTVGLVTLANTPRHQIVVMNPVHATLIDEELRADDPEQVHRILRRAADLRSALRVSDGGLAAAYELGDLELCAEILDWFGIMISEAQRPIMHAALRAMSAETMRRHPGAALRAEMNGFLAIGTTRLRVPVTPEAIHELHRSGEAATLLNQSGIGVAARRYWGQLTSAAKLARRAEPVADLVLSQEEEAAGIVPLWYLQTGMACQLAGDVGDAERLYAKGWRVRAWDNSGVAGPDLAAKQAVLHAWLGNRAPARDWLRTAAETGSVAAGVPNWVATGIDSDLRLARALLAVDDLQQPADDVTPVGHDPFGEFWAYRMWVQAQQAVRAGQPSAVPSIVERHASGRPSATAADGVPHRMCALVLAEAAMAQRNGTVAQRELAVCGADFAPAAPAAVRLQLLLGEPAAARDLAATWLSREPHHQRVRAELLLLHAAAELRADDRPAAHTLVGRWEKAVANGTAASSTLLTLPHTALLDVLGLLTVTPAEAALKEPIYPDSVTVIDLTTREREVLRLLADGLSYTELAAQRYVSHNTVKSQVRSIYSRLGVSSRDEAIARATQLGLLRLDTPAC